MIRTDSTRDVEGDRNLLAALAQLAADRPFYLGHALAQHRKRFGLNEAEQRKHLGVAMGEWTRFKLCVAPETEDDLQALAERFGADRERLGRAVRGGE